MDMTCETCGKTFQAKRRTARFCSSGCRVRAHRGGGSGKVLPLKAEDQPPADAPRPAPQQGSVEAATLATLEEAGRLDSVMGQTALVLARRLDSTTMDTGSAIASLARQLEATVEAAVAGAHVADDPVDELRRRRDEKLGIVG